jgi:serine/threonine protein kinase
MDPERWEHIKEIFDAARELEPEECHSFLAAACGSDDSLRAEVERLLSAHRNAGGFMKSAPRPDDMTNSETSPTTFAAGQVISERYEILRFIGRGGMGEVYEAKDVELRTRVALKTIRQEISANPVTLARFRDELKLARRITHRSVCRTYHLERGRPPGGVSPDITFITMELLEGETLARRLNRIGRMSAEEALPLVRQMAEGLAAAHEAGVVHCDFKPGNVMLVSETPAGVDSQRSTQSVDEAEALQGKPVTGGAVRAVITDFGLARAVRRRVTRESIQESLTGNGRIVGTLPYMAPEQLEGCTATPATDVYALGLVIYEMVTGRQPFSGPTPLAAAYKRLKEPPPPPRSMVPGLDPNLESIILRCLETKSDARFPSATKLVEALGGGVGEGPVRRPGSKLAVASWSLVAVVALFAILSRIPIVRTMAGKIVHSKGALPATDLTTSSPEARRRYLLAQNFYAKQDWNGALNMAQSALRFDPDFPMLHLLLAKTYQQLGHSDSADEHVRHAVQYSGHVTERERYLIEAMDYRSQALDERAAERYRLVLSLYPNDLDALRGLAATDYWVDKSDEAVGAQRRAAGLTHSPLDYKMLMDLLDRTNRFADALAVAAEARSSNADSPDLHFAAGLAYWGEDDLGAARQQFEILRRGGTTYGQNLAELYTAHLLIYQGRIREADAELRTGLVLNRQQKSEDWAPLYPFLLAHDLVLQGQLAAAKEEAAKFDLLVTGGDSPDPVDLQRVGSLALALGDLKRARELLAILDKQRAQESAAFAQLHFFNLQGNLELNEGRIEAAIEDEKRASVFYPSFEPYLSLGRAYTAERDWKSAIGAYERYLQFRGEILRDDYAADLVLTQLYLGRLYAESGQPSQAASHYDEFLHLWADADPDLPVLREAQAEKRRLHVN